MALQSQAPRTGTNRRYSAGGRRKKSLAPWLALLGVAVVIGGLIILFSGGGDATKAANAAPNDDSDATQQNAGPDAAAQASQPAPTRQRDAVPKPAPDREPTPARPKPQPINTLAGQDAIAAANAPGRSSLQGETKDQYETGLELLGSDQAAEQVAGRALLSELLFRSGALPRHEAQGVRELLTFHNSKTVFTRPNRPRAEIENDPILTVHTVQSGEYLSTIANTYRTPYQFIERVNNTIATKLQVGQALQVLKGPVHARIDKSDYRMDLYVVDDNGLPIYLKSFPVGLGEFDSTPNGLWRVTPGSKVGPENGGPMWRNPRTGKVYDRNDPDIPIGEYWMGLEGIDDNTREKQSYGIHATNNPDSIGQQASMGCIRMRDEDIDEVFYTLFEGASTVEIVP